MSYIINNSRGQIVAVVGDGTVNTTSTDLALVGRAVTNYGEYQNENYVFLLENFANDTAPIQPILGQLWYNSNSDVISAYSTANVFVALASQDYVEAQKISPAFSGAPTAPTAVPSTANTQIATTGFVTNSVQLAGTPTAPTAIVATNSTQIATTAFVQNNKVSPAFSGTPTAPTAAYNDNSIQLATTAFVQGEKVSPALSGTPTAPTATIGTATTQIATTEFVQTALGPGGGLGTIAQQNANAVAITGGSITGISALAIDSGGTAASSASGARTNLGLGTIATQDAGSVNITGGVISGITPLDVSAGGTGGSTAATARAGLGIGTIAVQDTNAVNITGGAITGISPLPTSAGGTGSGDLATARINLGLGTIATQSDNNINVTGGSLTGIAIGSLNSPLGVGSGGTGASSAFNARTNLGLGSMSTQNLSDVYITGGAISGIDPLSVVSGGTGANSAVQARTNLGLGTLALQDATAVAITGGVISGITPLSLTDGGTGANSASAARTNLGLASGATTSVGSLATQNANAVTITGGTVTGIQALTVADGGTGATLAAAARVNLGAAALTTTITGTGGISGGGDLSTNRTLSISLGSNGYGTRYVSTATPSGGNDGDIWYQV